MAITKLKPSKAAEAFTAEAPDARPEPKLRGKKRLLAITLPPDLIEALDVAAETVPVQGEEDRIDAAATADCQASEKDAA